MKLSDYVAQFLVDLGAKHVFVMTGGAALHLIDSIAKNGKIKHVVLQHEQAVAMAADGYARASEMIGVTVTTSGPGATNLLTGTACAYDDSVPLLHITGQVSTFRQSGDLGVRQLGFQEAPIVDVFKPLTKYAILLKAKDKIRYELEKAVYIANSGRKGPVLIDIPDDLQREDIGDPECLLSYVPCHLKKTKNIDDRELVALIDKALEMLASAKRPILILGWGISLSGGSYLAQKMQEILKIPFVLTWGALDLLDHTNPLYAGTFGTHGSRAGNLAVQNSDCVLAIGTRLDTHHSGTPLTNFAR